MSRFAIIRFFEKQAHSLKGIDERSFSISLLKEALDPLYLTEQMHNFPSKKPLMSTELFWKNICLCLDAAK